MSTANVFRLLLVLSVIADLAAWTWRDYAYTRVIAEEAARAKGDQALIVTAALFFLFAIPLWRLWRWSGALMIALTALAVVGRLAVAPTGAYTTNDAIMLLEIVAATTWGAMLAIVFGREGRTLFVRPLI